MERPSEQLRLTAGTDDDMPSWSPDGRWIAFSSDRSVSAIFGVDLETRERRLLVENATDPQPLPDDGLAYLTEGSEGWRLVVERPSGHGPRRIPTPPGGLAAFAIAPDGDSLVYVAAGPRPLHRSDLYRVDLDGGPARRLTKLGQAESPVWCDDGSLLFSAYGASREPFRQVWRLDAGARLPVQITHSRHDKSPLQCSARPERITMRLTSDASGVFVLARDHGAWSERLAVEGIEGSWSPDGRSLAYVARVDGRTDVFVRETDGDVERVTDDELFEESVRWSADGRRLIFAARARQRDLWTVAVPELPWLEGSSAGRRGFHRAIHAPEHPR